MQVNVPYILVTCCFSLCKEDSLMESENIITFHQDGIGELRGFLDEKTQEPWFFAGKVCDCLKIKNSSDALNNLIEKHLRYGDKIKGVAIIYPLLNTPGGKQKVAAINQKTHERKNRRDTFPSA